MRQLRGRVSGLCQPHYMLDIPGGHGKSPIGPNYLTETATGEAIGLSITAAALITRQKPVDRRIRADA